MNTPNSSSETLLSLALLSASMLSGSILMKDAIVPLIIGEN